MIRCLCLLPVTLCVVEEFSKMKDEVPPALTDAHVKMVEDANKEGKSLDAEFGLEKSGIAGTVPEKEEGMKAGTDIF